MSEHLTWEVLNDMADGRESLDDLGQAVEHLRACDECATTVEFIRRAATEAAKLPRVIDPPAALWGEIRETIEARKVRPISAHTRMTRGWWVSPHRLAAAAVILVAVSSALTIGVMQERGDNDASLVSGSDGRVVVQPVASWQVAERGYQAVIDELREQLAAGRHTLAPETVATLERSLAAIDAAIAEAQTALRDDPANAALAELLASNYRHKVELMRRATQLMSST